MINSRQQVTRRSGENRLYGIGGACLMGAGAIYAASAVLSFFIGAAPSGADSYLRSLASHVTAGSPRQTH